MTPPSPAEAADCVFCEIITGRAPVDLVYITQHSWIIRPLGPVVDGHVLVIPREHVADFAEDADGVSARTMADAAAYARDHAGGSFNIITSAGRAATQSVFHLHVHVVPRAVDDDLMVPWGTVYGDDPQAPHWCRVARRLQVELDHARASAPTGDVAAFVVSDRAVAEHVERVAAEVGVSSIVTTDAAGIRVAWRSARLIVLDEAGAREVAAQRPGRRDGVVVVVSGEPPSTVWERAVAVGAEHVVTLPEGAEWLRGAVAAVAAPSAPGEAAETEGGDDACRAVYVEQRCERPRGHDGDHGPGDEPCDYCDDWRSQHTAAQWSSCALELRLHRERLDAPSPAPAEPESDTAGGEWPDHPPGSLVERVRLVAADPNLTAWPRMVLAEVLIVLGQRELLASPPPGRPAETGETSVDPTADEVLSALVELDNLTECRCGIEWTQHRRHAPECDHAFRDDVDIVRRALATPRDDAAETWSQEQVRLARERRAATPPHARPLVVGPARAEGLRELWRVGRRNPHTVYRQRGDEPRGYEHVDHDDSLGYFRHPEDAQQAVDAVNAASPRPVPADTEGGGSSADDGLDAWPLMRETRNELRIDESVSGAAVPDGATAVGSLIETVDELDRLPLRSVVRRSVTWAPFGEVAERWSHGSGYEAGWYSDCPWRPGVRRYDAADLLPVRVLDVRAPSPLAEVATLLGCTPDQVPARVRGLLDEQRGGEA